MAHEITPSAPLRDTSTPAEETPSALRDRLNRIVLRLQDEADRRVMLRGGIEKRWIEDLRQYHGRYSEAQIERMKEVDGSSLFISLTRPKTNALIARLHDLLFPTDDKNWGIGPTPVPELTEPAEQAMREMQAAQDQLSEATAAGEEAARHEDRAGMAQAEGMAREAETRMSAAQEAHEALEAQLEEARGRARLMAEEIDDQLKTCRYAARARDVIEDICKLGTGILKGPVVGDKTRAKWSREELEGGASLYRLQREAVPHPEAYRVDPWGFFPPPEATSMEDCDGEGIFERHLMTAGQFRKFAKRPDVDKEIARAILKAGPTGNAPTYLPDLYAVTGQSQYQQAERFVVWEYTGPLDPEEVAFVARMTGRDDFAEAVETEYDPLEELIVRAWFCDGRLLAFGEHPLDSAEHLYSVSNLEKDESSLFGFGLPYIMRDDQSALNAAWRMMMDNAGLSTGPQIVVHRDKVEPSDGDWVLRRRKIWFATDKWAPGDRPFETFDIPNHQAELANIIALARQQVDEVTNMPAIAQGEQGTGVTKTAQGMALLMNSANVVFRRLVKNFDDDMTVPTIRRFYDFNMQFSRKEHIKGDYEVDARGSSVLLVREMQSQNLMMIALQFGGHPIYGAMLKDHELLTEIFKANMLSAGQFVVSKSEWEKLQREQSDPQAQLAQMQAQEAEAEREIKREEMQLKAAMAEREAASREVVANLNYEAAMMTLAEKLNMSAEDLAAKIQDKREERASKERQLAVEVGMAQRTGKSAGGSV